MPMYLGRLLDIADVQCCNKQGTSYLSMAPGFKADNSEVIEAGEENQCRGERMLHPAK